MNNQTGEKKESHGHRHDINIGHSNQKIKENIYQFFADQAKQSIDVKHKEHHDDQDRQKFQMKSYLIRLFIAKLQRHSDTGSQI